MSKVTRPILTGVFSRKRLFDQLDRMREQPVIWVSGPAGCGKTTLVSSYLEARHIPILWYQIDQGDGDPATFFYYLGQAAKKAAPRKRRPLPLLTPEYLQGISKFTLRYFEELYSRLNPPIPPLKKGGKEGFIIVFDNYHEVPADSSLHEVILNGLSRIPEGINVILISRSDPPPTLIRLRANHLMGVLGWNNLQLTPGESEGIVRLRAKHTLSREMIQRMHRKTDGWAAGLVLCMESEKIKDREPETLGKLAPEEIFDYFASEIFDRTDQEIQDFLLKTAFLPKMTSKIAEELTGLTSADRILSTLSRNNYFTEKHFHPEPIYQYHSLFREFLLSRAKITFSADTLSVLLRRAAILLEKDAQTEAAVGLLRDANDWDGMVHLIMEHAATMVAQGRNRPLEAWLSSLPKDILENDPWLLHWMGTCCLPFNPSASLKYFEKAFERFKGQKDSAGTFLAWSGIVDSIVSGFEDFKPLDRWILVFEELMQGHKEFPSEEIKAIAASSMFYALVSRQPHHPEVETWAERALGSAEKRANVYIKLQILIRLAIYKMYIGDTRKTLLAIHQIRQLSQSPDAPPLALLAAEFAEAMHYGLMGGMHEKCLKAVSEALELAQTTGVHRLDHMLLGQGVMSALKAHDLKTVERLLDRMALASKTFKPWEACFYHLLRTREGLLRGDLQLASLHGELSLKFSMDVGSPNSSVRCHLANAHVMHQLGKQREAAKHLAITFNIAHQIKAKNSEFWALLAEALFALDQGKEASALKSLQKALLIGREEGYFNTCIDRPFAMARLCVAALEAGIEVEYVQELIRKLHIVSDTPPFHLENWPWPLKIYTLGGFRWLRDDSPIKFARKTQQRPLSMLKALLALGGKEVREDQISDALWPEADGDVAHESFATTLHRLRRLIGQEKAIQLREGRLTLDEKICWVDIRAFERILAEADAGWKKGMKDQAIGQIEKAMEIYRGPFLAGEPEQTWAVSIRERLRSKFLKNMEKMGHYWQETEQWGKALECCQKGLEIDELAEEFYQGLMTCYQHLGRRAEALSVYNRCQRILSAKLGVEPSPKTEALYQFIKMNR